MQCMQVFAKSVLQSLRANQSLAHNALEVPLCTLVWGFTHLSTHSSESPHTSPHLSPHMSEVPHCTKHIWASTLSQCVQNMSVWVFPVCIQCILYCILYTHCRNVRYDDDKWMLTIFEICKVLSTRTNIHHGFNLTRRWNKLSISSLVKPSVESRDALHCIVPLLNHARVQCAKNNSKLHWPVAKLKWETMGSQMTFTHWDCLSLATDGSVIVSNTGNVKLWEKNTQWTNYLINCQISQNIETSGSSLA